MSELFSVDILTFKMLIIKNYCSLSFVHSKLDYIMHSRMTGYVIGHARSID